MNKRRFSLDKYWEDKLDFRYNEEILRYKMLCNDKIPKRTVKKYNLYPRYSTFGEWEKYTRDKISKLSNEELREYQKYINLKRTNENSISGIVNNFFVPFLIAVVGPLIVEGLKACIDLKFDNALQGLISWAMAYFLFLGSVYFFIWTLSTGEKKQLTNHLFYNDIYEIVQKEIEKRD